MSYLKQTSLNTLVLARYFQLAQEDNPGYTEDDLAGEFKPWVSPHRISLAISAASDAGYIEDVDVANPEYVYAITRTGYKKAEEFYLVKDSRVKRFLDIGIDAYFSEIASQPIGGSDADQIPASDRFVRIGDNLPGYTELTATIEAAEGAVRGSNQLGVEERSWIRLHLDLGLQLLRRGGTALRSALTSLLVEPLKTALKESSEDGVKAVIRTALDAIKTYLGID